jgi:hypothetical protein
MSRNTAVALAAIGILGGLFGLSVGPTLRAQQPGTAVQSGQPGGAPGRYQIVISTNVRADTFLLDTATGKTWTHGQATELEGDPSAWVFDDRLDNRAQLLAWAAAHKSKQQVPEAK